ncbi:MAG: LamG-like jellyroll fold domain-containing protein [Spirochaetota bacterium]
MRSISRKIAFICLSTVITFAGLSAADDAVAAWDFNDGTFSGKTSGSTSFVDGIDGKALAFDGTSSAEASASPTPGNSITLEVWVKIDTTEQEWSGILMRWVPGSDVGYGILYRSAGNGFRFVVNSDDKKSVLVQTEKEQILPGVWYHLAATYDGKTLILYLNGKPLSKAASLSVPEVKGPVYLGKAGPWAKTGLRGAVDDVRIYGRALSSAEVNAHYRALVKGTPVKYIVCDFEDVGTWRHQGGEGSKGKWFAGHINLSSTKKETCSGAYAGIIRYAFTEPSGPYRHRFIRAKIMEEKVSSVSEISFRANPKDKDGKISIELSDNAGKNATTEAVRLEKNTWQEYTIPFDEAHVKGASSLESPIFVSGVNFYGRTAGEGEVYLDDIALSGETSDGKQLVTVSPVYRGVGYRPNAPIVLEYRVRNGMGKDASIRVSASIVDFFGKASAKDQKSIDIAARGESAIRFSFPAMDIGHYRVTLSVSGAVSYGMEDMFGVFIPNGKRLNRTPMFFGCDDQEIWKGEEENALHKTWMGALGVDIERFGITGGRFEHAAGDTSHADGFTPMLNELAKYGIDSFVCYFVVPEFTGGAYRKPPKDEAAFAAHVRNLGAYLAKFPGVKYIELWNEPDLEFFHGTIDEYVAMMKTFYTEIKKTAPNIRVTTGGVTVKHPKEKKDFTKDMFTLGKGYYDVAAFHAHGPLENYIERQEMVEGYLRNAGVTAPICNTEAGDRSLYDYAGYRSQAVTLVKKISYAKSRPLSEFYSWFTLKDYWDMDPGADDSLGMVTADNRFKPAFVAYNELIRELANTIPDGAADIDARLDGYRFKRSAGGRVYVVWPKNPGAVVASVRSSVPVTRTDMFGRSESLTPEDGSVSVTVAGYPVYLSIGGDGTLVDARTDVPFLISPSSVYAVPGGKASFTAMVTNIALGPVSIDVGLMNETGSRIGGGTYPLALGGAVSMPFTISVAGEETYGQKNYFYSVSMTPGSIRNAVKPLSLCVAYPITYNAAGFAMKGTGPAGLKPIIVDALQSVIELAFDPTIPRWKNAADLSVKAYAAHDGKGLYAAFDTADDVHVTHDKNSGDGVEIGILSEASSSIISLGATAEGAFVTGRSADSESERWDVPAAARRTAHGVFYEVYVAFEKIGISVREDAIPVRFAFIVHDDDGKGRVRYMEWGGGLGRKRDASRYGFGLLAPR